MEFNVEFRGLDSLISGCTAAGYDVEPLMRVHIANSVTEITGRTRSLAPHATGTLQRSILPEMSYPTSRVKVNVPYGIFVETGTRPHWPPIDPIRQWASKVGFTGPAFLVARAIASRGTRAQPFWAPGIEQSLPAINRETVLVANRLMAVLAGRR